MLVLAAAKVGGIKGKTNSSYPADFLLANLKIKTHLIETAWRSGGCDDCCFWAAAASTRSLPSSRIREESLLAEALELTNEWCAIANITGIKLCEALRIRQGSDAISLMLTNFYGPGDNYQPTNSYVLPPLIRCLHEAAEANAPSLTCCGSGSPQREFLHVNDLGEAWLFVLEY